MKTNTLKEKTVHGNAMFPLKIYSIIDSESTYSLSYHWHDEVEIIYVEEGEIIFNIDMKPIKVNANECLFINSHKLHSAYAINSIESIHHAIVFDMNILSSSIYDYCQSKYIDPLLNSTLSFPMLIDKTCLCGNNILTEIRGLIDIYYGKHQGWELSVKASLLKIISFIADQDKFIKNTSINLTSNDYKVERIKIILDYIYKNYKNKIYIDELAKEANMNSQYFCRFFKSLTGKSPISYINHYRIEKAAKLLQTQNYKVMEICFIVGFDNFSYFIKKFKEYKNCTPSEYKKMGPSQNYKVK
ncbi:AraC family transcriptional regulator [Clostridium uliginosum]|uniref:AraC-type DNA-binding protein n=1 Tax=Clostridium uliginosum TaxID=119641 RepID=A0A1I1PAY5_9CLOT|nr:helix-turn-helix domain-containing protein [Clostridium uliginosum]SFD07007.1 AraC-type DNA-binding protein [Clostridium uliginosum]